ncbi:hypothetical protein PENTCL1PPCAC_22778, partial [Pristionchus entomophagus]
DVSDDDAEPTGAASPSRTQRTYYLARVRHDGDEDVVEREHVKPESYGIATTSYDGPLEDTPREDDLEHLPIRDHAKVYHHGQSWRVDKEKSPKKEKPSKVPKAPKEKKTKTPKGATAAAAPTDEQTGKEHVYYIAKVPKESEDDENADAHAHEHEHPSKEPHGSGSRPLFGWLRSSGRTKRGDDHGPAEHSPSDEYYALAKERYEGPLDGLDRRDDLENLPLGIRVALPSTDKKKTREGAGDVSDDDAEPTGADSPSRTQRTYYLARVRHDGDEDVVEREHVKPESYGIATTSYDGPLEDTPREDDLEHLPIRDHAKVYHHGQSWRVDKEKSPKKEKPSKVPKAPKEKKTKTPKGAAGAATAAAPTDEQTGKEHVYYIAKVPKESEDDENADAHAHEHEHPSKEPHGSGSRPLFGWLRSSGRTKRGDDHGPAEHSPSEEYYALAKERYEGPLDGLDRRDDFENLPLGIRVALPSTDKEKTREGAGDVSDDDAEPTGAASPSRTQRTYYLARVRHDGDEDVVEREHVKPESYGIATTSYDGPLEDTPREDDLEHLPIRDHAKVYHHGQSWRVDKEKSPKKEKPSKVPKAPKEKKTKTPKGAAGAAAAAAPTDEQTGKEHVYYIAKVPKESEDDENADAHAHEHEHPSKEPHGSGSRPLFGWLRSSGRTKRGDDHGPAEHSPSEEYYALAKERYEGPLDGLDRRDDLENLPLGIRVALPSTDKKKTREGAGDVSDDDAEPTGAASPSRTQRTYYLARVRHDGDEDVVEREHVKPESYGIATTSYDGPLEDTPREDDLEHLPIRDQAKVYHHGQSWRVDKEKSPKKEKPSKVPKAPKEKKTKTPKGAAGAAAAAAPTDEQTGKEHVYYIAKVPKESEDDENADAHAHEHEHPSKEPHGSGSRPLFGWLRSSGRTKRGDDHGPAEHSPSEEYYALAKERYEGPLDGLDRRDDLENLPLGIRVALPSTDKKKTREGAGDVSDDDAEPTGAASPSRTQRTYYLARVRHDGDEDVVEREHVKPESYGIATTSYDGPLEDTPREDDLEHLPIRDQAKVYHHGQSWRVDKEKSPKKEKPSKVPKAPKAAAAAPTDEQTGKEHVYYIAKVPKESEDDENADAHAHEHEHPSKEPHGSGSRPLFGWLRSSGRTKRGDDHGPAEHSPSEEYYALAKERYEGPLDGLDRRDDLENLPLGIRVALPSTDKKKTREGAGDVSDDDAEPTGAASPSRTQRTYYLARVRHDGDEDVVEREHVKPESYGIATTSYDGPLEDTPREDDLEHLPIRDQAKVYHHGQSWRVDKEKSPKKEKPSKVPKAPKAAAAAPTDEQTGKEHVYYIAKVPKESEDDWNADAHAHEHEHPSKEPHGSGSRPLFGWLRSSGRTKRGDDHGPAEHSPSDEYYALAKERYEGPLDGLDRRDDLENLPLGIRVALPSTDKKKTREGAGDVSDDDAEPTRADSPSRTQRTYYLARVRHDGDEDVVEREHVKPESYGIATTSYDGPLEDTPREDDLEHLPIRDHAKVYHHGQSWRVDKEKSPKKEKPSKVPKAPKAAAAAPTDEQTGKEHVYYIAKVPKESEDDENADAHAHEHEHPSKEPHGSGSRPLFGWLRSSGRTKRGDDHGPAEHSPSEEYYALAKERYEGPLDGLDRRDDFENLPLGIRVALPSTDKEKTREGAGDVSDDDAEPTGAASPSRTQRTYYLARVRHDGDEDVVEREHVKPESYGIATTSYDGPLEDTPREDDLEHLPIRDQAKVYHHGQSWRVDKEKSPKKEKPSKVPKAPKAAAAAPTDEQTGKEHVYYIAKVPKESEDDENADAHAHEHEHPSKEPHGSGSRPLFGWLRSSGRTKRGDDHGPAEHSPSEEYYALAKERYEGPLDGLDRRDDLENLPLGIRVALPSTDKKKTREGAGDVSDDDAEPTGAASPSRTQRTYYLARVRHDGDEDVVEREHVKPESYGIATTSYDGPLEDTPREDDLEHLPIRDHAKVYHHGQSWRVDKEKSPKKEKPSKVPKAPKAAAAAPTDEQTGKEHVYYIAKVPKESEDDENADAHAHEHEHPSKEPHGSGSRPLFGWLRSSGRTKRGDDHGPAEHSPSDEYYALAKERYEGPLDGLDRRDDLENLPLGIRVALPSTDKKKTREGAGDVSDDDAEPTGAASPSRTQRTYYLARVRHDGDEDVVEREHVKPESYGIATTSYDGPLEDTPREDDLEHLPIRDHAKVYHHGQSWRVDKEKSPKKEKPSKVPKAPKAAAAAPTDEQTGKEHVYYIAKVPKESEDDENADAHAHEHEHPSKEPHGSGSRPLFGWLRSSGRTKRGDDHGPAEHSPSDEYYALAKERYEGPLDGLDRRDDLENLPLGIRVALPSTDKKKTREGAGDVSDDDAEPTGAASPSRTQRTYYLARVRHDGDEDVVEREHVKPESYGIATTSYDGPLEDTPREDDLEHLPIRDHAKVYHHGQSWRVDKEKSPKKEKPSKVPKAPKEKKTKTPKGAAGAAAAAAPTDEQTGKEHVYYIAKVPKESEDDENADAHAHEHEHPSKEPHGSGSRPLFGWLRSSGRTKRGDDHGPAEHSPSDEYYALAKERYEGPLDGLDRRDDLENLPLGIRVALPSTDKKKTREGAGDVSDDDAEPTGAASPSRTQRTYYLARVRHDGDEDVVEREHVKPESYGIATTSYDGPLEDTPREDDLEHLPIRDHAKVYHHGQSWRVDKEKSPKKKTKTPKGAAGAAAAAAPTDEQTGKEHVYYIAKVPKESEDDENADAHAHEHEHPSKEPHGSGSRPLFGWLRSSGRTKRGDDHGPAEHSPSDEYYALAKERYEGPLDGLDRRDDLENLPLGIRVALPSTDKKKTREGAGDVSDDDAEPTGAASPSRTQRTYYLARVRHDGDEDVVEREHVKPESYGIATTSYDGPLEDTPREDDLEHLPIRDHAKVYHHDQSWRVDKEKSPKKEKPSKVPKAPKAAAAATTDEQTGKEHVYYIAKVPKESEDDENADAHAHEHEHPSKEPHGSGSRPLFGWLRSSGRTKRGDDHGPAEHSPSEEYYALAKERYEGPLDGLDRRDDLENLPLGIRVALPSTDKKKTREGAGDVSDDDAEPTGAASPSRTQRTYYLARVRHDGDEDVVEREHVKPESYGIATTSYDGPLEDTPREDDLEHLPIRDHAKVYHHGQSWRVDKEKSPKKEKPSKVPKAPKAAAAATTDEQTGKEHVYYIANVPKESEDDENADAHAHEHEHPSKEPHGSGSRPLFGWLRSSGRTKRGDDHGPAEHSPSEEYYALAKERYEGPLDGLDRRDDLENLPLGIRVALPSTDKKKTREGAGDVSDDDAEPTGAASPSRTQRTYYLARVRHDGDEDVVEREHVKPESYGIATTSYDGPLEDTPREDDLEHLPIRDHAKVYHHGQSWRVDKEKSPKKEKPSKVPKAPKAAAAAPTDEQTGKEHVYYIAKVPKESEDDENADAHAHEHEHPSKEPHGSGSRPLFGWLRSSGRTKRGDDHGPAEHSPSEEYYALAKERYEGPLDGLDRRDDLENLPLGIRVALPSTDKKKTREGAGDVSDDDAEPTGAASPSRTQRTYYLARVRHDGDEDVVEREHVKPESYGIATTSYDGPLEDTPREDDLEHLPIRDHAKVYHHGQSWRVDKEKSPKKEKPSKVPKAPKEKKTKTPKGAAGAAAAAAPTDEQTGKEHVYYIAKVPKESEDDENADAHAHEHEHPSKEPHGSGSRPLFGWLRSSGRTKRGDDHGPAEHSPSDEYYALAKERYEGPLDGLDRRDDLENLPLGIRVALPSTDKKKTREGAGDVSDDDAEPTGAASPSRTQRTYYLARVRHDGDEDVVEREHVKPESYGIATTSYDGPLEDTPREDDLEHLPIRDHAKVYHHDQSWRVDKEKSPKKEKPSKVPKAPKAAAAATTDEQTGKEHVYYIAKVPKESEDDENADAHAHEHEHPSKEPHGSGSRPLFGWLRSSGRTKRGDDHGPAEHSPSEEYYALAKERYEGPLDGLDRRDDLENLPLGIRVALPSTDKKKTREGAGDVSDDDAEPTGAASPSRTQRTYYLARVRHDGDEDVVEREHVKPESYGIATTSYDGPLEDTPREDDLEHLPIRDHAKVYHHGQSWRVDKEKSPKKEKPSKVPKAPKAAAAAPTDEQTGKEHVYYIAKVPKESEDDENADAHAHEHEHPSKEPHGSGSRPLFGWLRSSGRTKRGDDHGPAEHSPSDEYYALAKERYEGPLDGLDRRDDLENLPLGIRVALPSTDKKKTREGAGDVSDDDAEPTGAASPSRTQRTYYLARVRHDGDEDVVEREHVKPESYGIATTSYDGPLEDTPREDDLEHLPIRDHAKVYHHDQSWRVDKEKSPKKEKPSKVPKAPKAAAAATTDEQTGKEHVYYIAKVPKESEDDENADAHAHEHEHPSKEPHGSGSRPLFGWLRSSGRTKRGDDHGPAEHSPSEEYYALAKERYEGPLDGLDRRDDLENLPLGIRVALPSTDKKKTREGAGDVSDDDAEPTGAASPSRTQRTYYLARVRHDGDEDVVEREHVKPESYGIATTSYDGPLEDTPREDDLEHLPIRDHAKVYHHGQSWRVDKEKPSKVPKAPKEKKTKTPKGAAGAAAAAAPTDEQTGKEHVYYIAKVPKESEDDENADAHAHEHEHPSKEPHGSGSRPLFGWLRSSGRTKRGDDHGPAEHSPSDEYYALAKERYEGPLDGLDRRDDLENLPLGIRVALPSTDKKKTREGAGDVSDDDAEPTGAASPSRTQRTYYLARVRHDGDEDVVEREHVKPESYGIATTSYDGPLEDTPREDDLEHLPIRDHAKVYHHDQSWRVDKEKSPKKEKPSKVPKAPKEKKTKTPKGAAGAAAAAATTDEQTGKEHVYYIAKVPKESEDDENADAHAHEHEHPSKEPHGSGSRPLFGWLRSSGRTKRGDDHGPAEHSPSEEYYALAKERYEGPLDGLDRRDDLENLPLGIRVALPSTDKKKTREGAGDVSDDDAEPTGAASPSRTQRTYYLARVRHDGDEDVVEREHVKPESYGIATTSYDGPLEDTPREDDLEHLPIRDHAKVYHHGQSWRVDKEKPSKVPKAPKEKKTKTPKGAAGAAAAAAPTDEQTGKEHVYYIAKVPKESEDDENADAHAHEHEHPSKEPHGSGSRPLFGWLRSSGRTKRGDDHGPAEHSPADEYYALAKERYEGPLDGLDRRDDLENLPLGRVIPRNLLADIRNIDADRENRGERRNLFFLRRIERAHGDDHGYTNGREVGPTEDLAPIVEMAHMDMERNVLDTHVSRVCIHMERRMEVELERVLERVESSHGVDSLPPFSFTPPFSYGRRHLETSNIQATSSSFLSRLFARKDFILQEKKEGKKCKKGRRSSSNESSDSSDENEHEMIVTRGERE